MRSLIHAAAARVYYATAPRTGWFPPPPLTAAPVDITFAQVGVGTRIIDLRDGRTQCEAVVVEVRDECVIARFDPQTVGPQTFAARWDEYGVVPHRPAGAEGQGEP